MTALHPIGTHLLADLHGVAAALLRDAVGLDVLLRRAALAAGSRILSGHFHHFGEAGGVTGVILLAESHISLHTWPEFAFAAADIFMCGAADPARALAVVTAGLAPVRTTVKSEGRGSAEPGGRHAER